MHKRARNPSQMAENCAALISEPLTLTAQSSRVVLLGCSRKGIKAICLSVSYFGGIYSTALSGKILLRISSICLELTGTRSRLQLEGKRSESMGEAGESRALQEPNPGK